MATIYDIKPQFQVLLWPLARRLAMIGVTANQVTVAAAVLSVLAGSLIALWPDREWPLLVLPATLFIRMALNAIDGMLAREHGMKSRLGAVLNELGDVISDASLYAGASAWHIRTAHRIDHDSCDYRRDDGCRRRADRRQPTV